MRTARGRSFRRFVAALTGAVVPLLSLGVGAASAALGSLTFVEVKQAGGFGGALQDATGTAVSPDGENVYVRKTSGVTSFSRDAGTGKLTQIDTDTDVGGVDALQGGGEIAVSPDGDYVYVASDEFDSLVIFTRNNDGTLTYLDHEKDGVGGVNLLEGAHGVAVSADSSTVVVAADIDNSVTVFQRQGNGTLTVLDTETDGSGGVNGLDDAGNLVVAPDGEDVYVTSGAGGDDGVADFSRASNGALTFNQFFAAVSLSPPTVGPKDVVVSPDNAHVYVTMQLGDAVVSFSRAGNGTLSQVDADKDGEGGVDGIDSPFYLAISPDGASVYVTGAAGTPQGVSTFSRNAGTGALTYLENDAHGTPQLLQARGVAVSPDNRHVYVSAGSSDATNVFSREFAPANTTAPSVTGSAVVGSTLTCATGAWTGNPAPTLGIEWLRSGTPIPSETDPTYVTAAPDVGEGISCRVTATNSAGSADEESNAITVTEAPANTAAPSVSGAAEKGSTLTCSTGTWTGTPAPALAIQWHRNGAPIAGQTGATYATTAADVGANVSCRVTATNSAGTEDEDSNGIAVVDTTPPVAAAASKQSAKKPLTTKGVEVGAECSEGCTLEATGILNVPKSKKGKGKAIVSLSLRPVPLKPAAPVSLPTGGSATLTVGVTKPIIKQAQTIAFGKPSAKGKSLAITSKQGQSGAGKKPVTATVTVAVTATDSSNNKSQPSSAATKVTIKPPTTTSSTNTGKGRSALFSFSPWG